MLLGRYGMSDQTHTMRFPSPQGYRTSPYAKQMYEHACDRELKNMEYLALSLTAR